MRNYELVAILSPMLNQDQATEAWGQIKDFITNRDAEITREQAWGTRRLAYPIRKGSYNFLEGSYYLTQFATERPSTSSWRPSCGWTSASSGPW